MATVSDGVAWVKKRLGLGEYTSLPITNDDIAQALSDAQIDLATNLEVPECYSSVEETLSAGSYTIPYSTLNDRLIWIDEIVYSDPDSDGKRVIRGVPWQYFITRYKIPPGDGNPDTFAEHSGEVVFNAVPGEDLDLEIHGYLLPITFSYENTIFVGDQGIYYPEGTYEPPLFREPYYSYIRAAAAMTVANLLVEPEQAAILEKEARSQLFKVAAYVARRKKAGHMRRSLATGGFYGIA